MICYVTKEGVRLIEQNDLLDIIPNGIGLVTNSAAPVRTTHTATRERSGEVVTVTINHHLEVESALYLSKIDGFVKEGDELYFDLGFFGDIVEKLDETYCIRLHGDLAMLDQGVHMDGKPIPSWCHDKTGYLTSECGSLSKETYDQLHANCARKSSITMAVPSGLYEQKDIHVQCKISAPDSVILNSYDEALIIGTDTMLGLMESIDSKNRFGYGSKTVRDKLGYDSKTVRATPFKKCWLLCNIAPRDSKARELHKMLGGEAAYLEDYGCEMILIEV